MTAAGIALFALMLSIAAGLDSRRLVGQNVPGFFVFDLNQPGDPLPQQVVVVAPIGLPHWSEPGATVPTRALVVAIDDQSVGSSADVYAAAAAKPAGTKVHYRLTSFGIPHTASVASRTFTAADSLYLFGPSALAAAAFLLVGLIALVRCSEDPLSKILVAVAVAAALILVPMAPLATLSPLAPIWLQLQMLGLCFLPAALLHWTLTFLEPERYARWRYAGYVVSCLLLVTYDAGSYYLPAALGGRLRSAAFFATGSYLGITGVLATGRYLVGDWSEYATLRHPRLLRALALLAGVTFPGIWMFIGMPIPIDTRLAFIWLSFPLFGAILLQQRKALRAHEPLAERAERPLKPPVGEQVSPVRVQTEATTRIEAEGSTIMATSAAPEFIRPGGATLRKEGEYWTALYDGKTVRLRDMVGLHYIAELLRHPGELISASVLVAAVRGVAEASPSPVNGAIADAGLRVRNEPNGGAAADLLLDAKSMEAYRLRLNELGTELAECEQLNDMGRVAALRRESDMLTDQLTSSVGRRMGGAPAERARLSVTKTIKSAFGKIGDNHPELYRHLTTHISTGYFCVYTPDLTHGVYWDV